MEILGAPRHWTYANPEPAEQGQDTDLAVRESVRPLLVLCAALQACAAVYYGPSVSGFQTIGLSLSAVMSSLLCLLVWARWRHWPSQLTGYVVGGLFAALLMHSLLRVAFDPAYGQPSGLALVIVACGATLFSMHWVMIAAAASLITWCAIAIPTLAAPVWIPGLTLLAAASGISFFLLRTRIQRHEQASKDEAKTLRWLRRLQAALDTVRDPIAVIDIDGRIRAHNDAWRNAPVLFPAIGGSLSPGVDFFQACRAVNPAQASHAMQLSRGIRQVADGVRDSYSQVCPAADGDIEVLVSRREIVPGGFGLTVSQTRPTVQPSTAQPTDHQPGLELLLRGSIESVWEWDLEHKRMYLSAGWHEMLGYAKGELTTDPDEWLERIHSRDLQKFMAAASDYIEGRADVFEVEHRICGKTDEYRKVTARGLAVRDEQGRAVRLVGTLELHPDPVPKIEPSRAESLQESLAGLSAASRAG